MNAPLPNAADLSAGRAWALALLIAAVLFAAVGPTLRWSEFTNGNEAIVVQTALEMRHGGPKLLPQLMGVPRVKKPPLVAWITAAAMRPATVAAVEDDLGPPALREAAYYDLLWQARWPILLAPCVLTLATFEWGRVWAGSTVGLCAAMAVGTNYLTLKYLRQTTTDAHLTAWIAVANAALAHGLLRGRWWAACVIAGLATGVAFLCKGPVALVQTIVPAAVFWAVLRSKNPRLPPWRAVVVGVVSLLCVALPWFIYVLWNVPGVGHTWFTEVSREGATNLEVSNPIVYLYLGPMTAPWLVFGVAGLLVLWQRRRYRAAWMAVVFAVVPVLVMVWFRDRKERYLLPMIAPACLVCGYGTATWVRGWTTRRTAGDRTVLAVHAIGMLVFVAGLLAVGLSGVKGVQRLDGAAWFSRPLVVWAAVATLALAGLIALLARRRVAMAVPAGTFLLMLGAATLYFYGYALGPSGHSVLKPLADAIRAEAPGAAVYDWLPRGRADEQIPLYLGRTVLRADPATLPAGRPTVVIARQAKDDPPADFGPGWRLLKSVKEGAATWSAFVRE